MSADLASHCPFRRRRKEARPAELLEAALALFVEKGFAATRSEEVARRAGVSKGTLYLYFPSKEELLKAVIQHYLADEIAAGAQEFAHAPDLPTPQLMEELLVAWWGRLYDSPAAGVFKLIIAEVRNFPEIARFYSERVIGPGHALVADLLARGVARGEFRALDVESAAQSVIMPFVLMCVHHHSLGADDIGVSCGKPMEADPRTFMRAHLRLLFQGLQVRAPAAAPQAVSPPRQVVGSARDAA